MTRPAQSITRITTLIAGMLALALTVLAPAAYFAVSYQYLVGTLDAQAEISARNVSGLVIANPEMWRFEEVRLMELLERRPRDGVPETRRILTPRKDLIAESANPLRKPLVSRNHIIYDAGTPVAKLEISRSLFPLICRTTLVALIALIAGALVYVMLRVFPLRAVSQAYRALNESEQKYRSLYKSMKEGVALCRFRYDDSGVPVSFVIADVNQSCEMIFGLEHDAVIGMDGSEVFDGAIMEHLSDIILSNGGSLNFELRLSPPDRFFSVSIFYPDEGYFAALFDDITQRKMSEGQIQKLAYSDSLTGLPNRTLFFDRLNQTLARADRNAAQIAVLFLDLDGFKVVNDTLGHASGDDLLLQVSQRLRNCIRSSDTLARLGGDEFVVLASYSGKELNIAHVAQNLLDKVAPAYFIDGREIYTSVSIGIALFPEDGRDAETLLRCADMAMYSAKEGGRNCYHFFSEGMNRKAHERMELETNLRLALERDEFFLEYQPILAAGDGSIVAAEALIRWQHPDWGRTMPGDFIAISEDSGLIVPMGEWVLRTACRKLKEWQQQGLAPLRLAVNVSGRQFAQRDFVDTVKKILSETGVDARFLELELTETSLMESADATVKTLLRLRELGLSIVIDDFGTGYSSLGYLKNFPIERLKIDRSFIADVCSNPRDRAIVEAIIAMADKLGLRVVAEGVETAEQADCVRCCGCHEIQGYFYHRPLSEEQFLTTVRYVPPPPVLTESLSVF